jgi:hypothetical protein
MVDSIFWVQRLLRVLNKKVSEFTGSGRAPMEYPLEKVVAQILKDSHGNQALQSFCSGLLKNMQSRRPSDKYVAYRKVGPVHAVLILPLFALHNPGNCHCLSPVPSRCAYNHTFYVVTGTGSCVQQARGVP